jgi:hypothetical protein
MGRTVETRFIQTMSAGRRQRENNVKRNLNGLILNPLASGASLYRRGFNRARLLL